MGRSSTEIDDAARAFIAKQRIFFVATAPTGPGGHVSCSPKGLDTFRVLGPKTVAYLDYTGSGAETIAHVRQNGRIVLMFCAFEGPPKIVRLHGVGEVIEPGDADFADLLALFEPGPGVRSILRVALETVSSSCGYAVPLMRYEGERTQLGAWAERKGEAGLAEYRAKKNATSIDGLPALRSLAPRTRR
jgi:hypothetical protein